jgi:hypothetical protein
VAEFSRIVGAEAPGLAVTWQHGPVSPWFSGPEQGLFRHTVPMSTSRVVDLARSRSYYLTADDVEQARLEAEIGRLVTTDPALAGRDSVDVPYLTCVYRMRPAAA